MMKRYLTMSLIALVVGLVSGCSDSPDKVFQTIALNANKIPRGFERHFKEIRQQKANGTLQTVDPETHQMKPGTASEFVEYFYGKTFDEDIKKVTALKDTEEVKPIKEAALEMFKYADDIYKTDFPKIAKMIDDGAPDEKVDEAVADLEVKKGEELYTKYEATMKLIVPYADKHGVEYKTISMP